MKVSIFVLWNIYGKHYAIKVDDVIYDNLNPKGIGYNEWLSDLGFFEQPSGMFNITQIPIQ